MNAITTLFAMLPFLLAIFLANVAEKERSVRVLVYLYLALLNGLLAVVGLFSLAGAELLASEAFLNALLQQYPGLEASQLRAVRFDLAGLILMVAALLAMIVLLPPVHHLAARLLPMRADSAVHVTALSLTATTLGVNLFQMIALAPLLFAVTATEQGIQQIQQMGGVSYLDVLVFPLLTFAIAALLGVGLYTRRSQAEVLRRLGFAPLTLQQLGIAAGFTIALLGMAIFTERTWQWLDPDSLKKVGGLSKALMGNFTGLIGALAIGVAAAIGEETFFRGAYQPRMGIPLTSLLFTSFHTQYGITPATLLVLVMSVLLGILRQRTSLTVCILVHFLYNFTMVLVAT
ncbi:MAG: CPBP family intramembrane glutamic endopeptidase [Anaerolineae bacterium]|nr:CPBP family intramembrane metalloprotease [Candidatus Roseilinea sp.]MDW8449562.1 CPBP family intramembrane glutamic endopeptidase [Anaerolineae bacterium]